MLLINNKLSMAYNEELAKRIRLAVKLFPTPIYEDFQEKKCLEV